MKKQYQVTLLSASGKYKPVSCIVNYEQDSNMDLSTDPVHRSAIKACGIQKICNARLWGKYELTAYEYTKLKIREYDKEKIDKEAAIRYEQIKAEKYATGEWKKPKKCLTEN